MSKYSFLVPTYKNKYLEESIQSILAQTYDDFTLIISNDNSPHDIESVVNNYRDNRVVYTKNKKNFGGERLVKHWNKLVYECQSEYLIMASDDDIYDSRFLEEIDMLTTKYPDSDVIRARVQRINNRGDVIAKEDIFDEFQSEIEAIRGLICGNTIGCIGNYVFKTDALKRVGGFIDFPYAWFSDMATVIAMDKNGQANTSKILFSFRLSGENISTKDRHKGIELGKLKATIAFDKWMSEYIVDIKHSSTLHQFFFNEILSCYKHRVYGQAGDYSWAIPIWTWPKIYQRFKQNKYFFKLSFFKFFAIAVLNRWFNNF